MQDELVIPLDGQRIFGSLALPQGASGLVVFAHGSGSSRFSPRNRFVAEELSRSGLATLLIDLLTEVEERVDLATREHRFDIALLAARLEAAGAYLAAEPELARLALGYFGSSTGAAAALVAAARGGEHVRAVVSRGGRPDLAGERLRRVRAATLLIVGGADRVVLRLNQQALDRLEAASEKELRVVPGASHLFEEPGALEEVTRLAAAWFRRHLAGPAEAP